MARDIIERLREEIRNCPGCWVKDVEINELKQEIERLRADKDVQQSQDRNTAYERDIAALEAEIERLRAHLEGDKNARTKNL